MNLESEITQTFFEKFGEPPTFIVRAPGRVNLIGEHTDYNLGYSLPMAIDRAIWIALRPRRDQQVRLYSSAFPEPASFSLDEIPRAAGWADYVHGMAWALKASGFPLSGWEGVLMSDIPVASGLSSSAALELAVGRAFWALTRWEWDGVEIAKVAKKHENEWMGLKSGILDQMISAIGVRGQAFLLDFKDLSYQAVPLPAGTAVVVMNTRVKRGLVDSAYNERVTQCQQAAAYFGVESLRDVSNELFFAKEKGLDDIVHRRARHIITENARTLQAVECMKEGDSEFFGVLMNTSHASLRDDYEVSCKELDLMVKLANQQPGCYGARMTGAGFGGCAIALADDSAAEALAQRVAELYEQETGISPEVYICQPEDGAGLVSE
jgi:galactokinase